MQKMQERTKHGSMEKTQMQGGNKMNELFVFIIVASHALEAMFLNIYFAFKFLNKQIEENQQND